MQQIRCINTDAVYELRNRFGWIKPTKREILTPAQAQHVFAINSRYVICARGILTIQEFRRLWASYKGRFINEVHAPWSPIQEALCDRPWKIIHEGVEYSLIIRPYMYGYKVYKPLPAWGSSAEVVFEEMGVPQHFHSKDAKQVLEYLKSICISHE